MEDEDPLAGLPWTSESLAVSGDTAGGPSLAQWGGDNLHKRIDSLLSSRWGGGGGIEFILSAAPQLPLASNNRYARRALCWGGIF